MGKNHRDEKGCFQKVAGTLTKDEICAYKLVDIKDSHPDRQPKFQTTTVDLTVGDGHYLFDGNASPDSSRRWKLIFIGDDMERKKLNKDPSSAKYSAPQGDSPHSLVIPAYGSALVQLNEIIDTYTVAKEKNLLIVGRFDLKLSRVHQGLISQQATQIEPYYRGKLFCFIHNLSNEKIELVWGTPLATLEFSYVSCLEDSRRKLKIINELEEKAEKKYSPKKNRFCNGTGIEEIRYFYEGQRLPWDCGLVGFQKNLENKLFSDESIDGLVKRLNKEIDKKAKWIPVICATIPVLCAIIAGLFAYFTAILPLKYENADLQKRITQLEETIKTIQDKDTENTDTIDFENKLNIGGSEQ